MKYFFTLSFILLGFFLFGQTSGTLSFTVKTVTYSAPYSPRHILAIWIADGNGTWVKTRKRIYQNTVYRQYLTNFKSATNSTYNATDAVTGATLQSHTTHTVTWDGKNVSGTLVADGTYRVYVEFTSANATGKLYYCEFTKGPDSVTLTPANLTNFQNISLTWTPQSTSAENLTADVSGGMCYPNPFSDQLVIKNGGFDVSIYDLSGKRVRTFPESMQQTCTWNGRDNNGLELPSGLYIIAMPKAGKTIRVVKQ